MRSTKSRTKKSKTYCKLGGGTPCGYCRLHRLTVTPKQMKRRQCLQKQCRSFVPWKQHPIWEQREREKQLKEERKALKKERLVAERAVEVAV